MLKSEYPRKNSVLEQPSKRIIIGIAGGSAAGKTTLCENITRQMAFDRNFKVQIISLDCFYRNIDKKTVHIPDYNFDHPNALDLDLAYETLLAVKQGKQNITLPQYSFTEHQRLATTTELSPANIIFFEGLMAFHEQRIRNLMTYKIFIHCDDDIRLCRRLKRDTTERGRTIQSVLHQYNKFVKKAFHDFIYPTMAHADLIIPGSRNNRVSIDFIVQHIKNLSRHMTFKQVARKTKTFCFGENQYYDLEYRSDNQSNNTMGEQSFIIFPTSQQHKRQLDFFLSSLLSQTYTYQYFCETFISQFMKVMKHLFKQLIILKGFQISEMEILSVYELSEVLQPNFKSKKIKVIIIPSMLNMKEAKSILMKLKQYRLKNLQTEYILLNFFADMDFPSLLYRLIMPTTILINLYIITNQKRFRQILIGNCQSGIGKQNQLLCSEKLTMEILNSLSQYTRIQTVFHPNFLEKRYQHAIENQIKQNQQINQKRQIASQRVEIGSIIQLPVQQQKHNNICGYHVLHNILSSTSKTSFIENYSKIKRLLMNKYDIEQYLKISNYASLEREDISFILQQQLFLQYQTAVLYYCFGYIQNSKLEIHVLEQKINKLRNKQIPNLYIILGVVNHFVLIELKNGKIYYMDSANTHLNEIMNVSMQRVKNLSIYQKRKQEIKKSFSIIQDIYLNKRSIDIIKVQCVAQEIIVQFNKLKDDKSIQTWFKEEYPSSVLKNDFLQPLSLYHFSLLKPQYQTLINNWVQNVHVKKTMGDITNYINLHD